MPTTEETGAGHHDGVRPVTPAVPPARTPDLPAAVADDLSTINSAAAHMVQVAAQAFSGPLPPPDLLEHYQRIQPDLVERLMGKKPELRFQYISENARFVEELDV